MNFGGVLFVSYTLKIALRKRERKGIGNQIWRFHYMMIIMVRCSYKGMYLDSYYYTRECTLWWVWWCLATYARKREEEGEEGGGAGEQLRCFLDIATCSSYTEAVWGWTKVGKHSTCKGLNSVWQVVRKEERAPVQGYWKKKRRKKGGTHTFGRNQGWQGLMWRWKGEKKRPRKKASPFLSPPHELNCESLRKSKYSDFSIVNFE